MSINNNNHKLVKNIILLKTDHKTERNELTKNKIKLTQTTAYVKRKKEFRVTNKNIAS